MVNRGVYFFSYLHKLLEGEGSRGGNRIDKQQYPNIVRGGKQRESFEPFTGRTNHAKIRLHSDGDVNPDIQDTYLDTTGAAIEDGGLTVSSTGSTGLPTRTTRRETTLANLPLNRRQSRVSNDRKL